MEKPKEHLIVKVSKSSTKFFGSWWAVVAHTLLVIVWFSLGLSLQIFMLWISLEAIFIWVVYLAASSRREEQRDKIEAWQQTRIKDRMMDNLIADTKQNEKLDKIILLLYELQKTLKEKK